MRSVLHVSVRLERGGAARVARTLSSEMTAYGYRGRMAYGYGPRAGASPDERDGNALRITSRPRALVNAGVHAAVGREVVGPDHTRAHRLLALAAASDLLHLHAIHSFMGPCRGLVQRLAATGVPIVWTLHDYWLVTGRCAVPGTCRRWAEGCGCCPNLQAYPAAALDLTRSGWRQRRSWVGALSNVLFVAPSRELAESFQSAYPEQRVVCVPNGVDRAFAPSYTSSETVHGSEPLSSVKIESARRRYAIIADDLSDKRKVPPSIVASLVEAGVELLLVGRSSPYRGPQIANAGRIRGRSELARIVGGCRGLLFLSSVDIFSMVLLEALTVGTPVSALPSANASEALARVGGHAFSDVQTLVNAVAADRNWAGMPQSERRQGQWGGAADRHQVLARLGRLHYSTDAMASAYAAVYDRVLTSRQFQESGRQ